MYLSILRRSILICGLFGFMGCEDEQSDKPVSGPDQSMDETMLDMQLSGGQVAGDEAGGTEISGGEVGGTEVNGGEEGGTEVSGGEEGGTESTAGTIVELLPQVCEQSIALGCQFGTQEVHTENGQSEINNYTCGNGLSFPGKELLFEFLEPQAQTVRISARALSTQYSVSYIMFALEGQRDSCEPEGFESAVCLQQQDTLVSDALEVEYEPDSPLWFTIDPRLDETATMAFELTVTCSGYGCGNGALNEGEQCDDGNQEAGDGCDANCQVEEIYSCSGMPSVCLQAQIGECEQLIEVGQGTYFGDTRACTSNYMTISGGCGNQNSVLGNDQSYAVTVPANKVLRATLDTVDSTGFAVPELWLAVDPNQAADTCVQSSSEELFWLNGSATAQTVLLTVDGVTAGDQGAYQLQVDFLDPPARPGASCAQAIEINSSGTYDGDTWREGLPSNVHGGVGGECVRPGGFWGYNGGPDEIYKVSLQANQTLTVNSSVVGNWDHVVSIHNDCHQFELSCLLWDDYGNGSITNTTGQEQDYYIMVGGFHSYSSGEYSIEFTIE